MKLSSIVGAMVVASTLTLLTGCATVPPPHRSAEPAVVDVMIPVGEDVLPATLHLASSAAPQPSVIWLHGFPGLPELGNGSIDALRNEGLNVLTLHYRGSWGAPGTFSAAHALEDANAAVTFLRSPETVAAYGIDPDGTVLMGDSFGSWVALQTAARDPLVPCVGAALVFDLGGLGAELSRDEAVRGGFEQMFSDVDNAPELGYTLATGASGLADEIISGRDQYGLAGLAPALRDRPVFLLGAEADELAPVEFHLRPFSDALHAAGNSRVTQTMLPGGHELPNSEYASLFADWVNRNCR
ncbi:MAG TPA: hypothetical protein VMO47_01150 [Rhodothermales bacterium]|nr:hypothetical protein [Rhodothermales bacterium]